MTVYLNATLQVDQSYRLITQVEIVVATGATAGTGSTLASVNMASGGKGEALTSYTIG
jgi:hypothetical protein